MQCSGPLGKGLGHMSARAEEGEIQPSKARSGPFHMGLAYLLSSQPSCLAHNPVLKMPGPR